MIPQNIEEKPQIEFNDNYDQGLMQTAYARIIISHIENVYPRVHKKMSYSSIIESYIDPKIMRQLYMEQEYRKQGYPFPKELALNDLFVLINDELQPYEVEEFLSEFDLDICPVIDIETI
jgi:hypothetical protein